jgi:hypothetical protein
LRRKWLGLRAAGWIADPTAVIKSVQSALRKALMLIETAPVSWALRGGMPSEIDLGFKIGV